MKKAALSSLAIFVVLWLAVLTPFCRAEEEELFPQPINVQPQPIAQDKSVTWDYDIAYVRAQRAGDDQHKRFFTDFSQPVTLEPGADLMLLHPDGTEDLLVAGGEGSITDLSVSFDGQWVYYTHIHDLRNHSQWSPPRQGADIFKIHVGTKKIVRLTNQKFSPNTGAANWSSDFRKQEEGKSHLESGVFNMGPFPIAGGRIVFTSNRDGFRPAKGYPAIALQLFVMDDRDESIGDDEDPGNLEKIGHLNISGALHPVALADGRIMYSTLESQGIRNDILWGLWTIHPDGTNWSPLVSAFDPGGAPNGFHFQTQLSDRSVIVEEYYNQNNSGFGALIKLPASQPAGVAPFGPAHMTDSRSPAWRYGRFDNGKGQWYRMPFMPTGSVSFTPFTHGREGPADSSLLNDKDSPKVGKFTHPSAAPQNHLLTAYSPGPVNHQYKFLPQIDSGIYLIKDGQPLAEPAQMLLIKNDPRFNECWPRAVVSYKRIYGLDQPKQLPRLANDGSLSPHLPEGTPFGLIGSSSLYKRESYPNGLVPEGSVTAIYAGGNDPWKGLGEFTSHGNGMALNWHNQGADSALYTNDEIHALRIIAQEPTTDRKGRQHGRLFHSHALERMRILGEIPVRKFQSGKQPLDPDGNPDTSFLARIPADTSFTFQTVDKDGMVLNMSQTWHQLRPGEIRHDCGGCHAHSQKPTEFRETAAAGTDYKLWDLVNTTPLVTARPLDESRTQWDKEQTTGLRILTGGPLNVEYFRDVQPILQRSCTACHTKDWKEPAGNLVLDADDEKVSAEHWGEFPGTYFRLALDGRAQFGHKPVGWDSWGSQQASRYVRKLQSRRSLLAWKIFGKRLDGFTSDDHPSESEPGKGNLVHKGKPVDVERFRAAADVDFTGSAMPPAAAIAGTYESPSGDKVKVEPLSDEDRRTLVRWIDLGCPIDLDPEYQPKAPIAQSHNSHGWMLDENRPILSLTSPVAGANPPLGRILIGMHDYYSGLDQDSLVVTADFPVDDTKAGENLAGRFQPATQGVWVLQFKEPIKNLPRGQISIRVKDRQGNTTSLTRTFSVSRR